MYDFEESFERFLRLQCGKEMLIYSSYRVLKDYGLHHLAEDLIHPSKDPQIQIIRLVYLMKLKR